MDDALEIFAAPQVVGILVIAGTRRSQQHHIAFMSQRGLSVLARHSAQRLLQGAIPRHGQRIPPRGFEPFTACPEQRDAPGMFLQKRAQARQIPTLELATGEQHHRPVE